jgi:hypothetical protein
MKTDALLRRAPKRRWFTLEELRSSLLDDVIAADARFQLRQAQARRELTSALRSVADLPQVSEFEFTAAVELMNFLAMTDVELMVDVEVRYSAWWERLWLAVLALIGRLPPASDPQFRPKVGRGRSGVQLKIRARRRSDGRWELHSADDASPPVTAQAWR